MFLIKDKGIIKDKASFRGIGLWLDYLLGGKQKEAVVGRGKKNAILYVCEIRIKILV